MNLNDFNTTKLDISDKLYETIKTSLKNDKGYRLAKNPLETPGKSAIVRAIVLSHEEAPAGLIRVQVYFDEIADTQLQ